MRAREKQYKNGMMECTEKKSEEERFEKLLRDEKKEENGKKMARADDGKEKLRRM